MENGHIPEDILYGELASGKRTTGTLKYKDVYKSNVPVLNLYTENWESLARLCKIVEVLWPAS